MPTRVAMPLSAVRWSTAMVAPTWIDAPAATSSPAMLAS
jgi:hypothetical protein